jgi:hypothetical protein
MKRLIDKLEEVRDGLYDKLADIDKHEHQDDNREKYYWVRLNSDQLHTVYNLIGDEIRKLK